MSNDIIVCLTSGDKFYSKAIKWATKSNVNHAFIAYFSDDLGYWIAMQADERGLVCIPAARVEYDYIECYKFEELDLQTAFKYTEVLIGDKYDWLGIVGFLIKLIAWRLLGRKIVNPLHKKGELFCSEFVTRLLQDVNCMYYPIMALNPPSVAPGGDPDYLGTPSLQYGLNDNDLDKISRVVCPWKRIIKG